MGIKTWNLSLKYAKAFFNLYGSELTDADFWLIKKAIHFLVQNGPILNYFSLHQSPEQQALTAIFLARLKLRASFGQLLWLLQKQKRIGLLPNVLKCVLYVFLHRRKKIYFKLHSYPALSPTQTEQVVKYLSQTTEMQILYESYEDPNLIAGIKMQSEQFLYDDTLSGRLQRIRRKLVRQN